MRLFNKWIGTHYYKWHYKIEKEAIECKIYERIKAGESINEKELFDELKLEKPSLLTNEIKTYRKEKIIEFHIPIKVYGMAYLPRIICNKYFKHDAYEYENQVIFTTTIDKYSAMFLETVLKKIKRYLYNVCKEIDAYNETIPKNIQKYTDMAELKIKNEKKPRNFDLKTDLENIISKVENYNPAVNGD